MVQYVQTRKTSVTDWVAACNKFMHGHGMLSNMMCVLHPEKQCSKTVGVPPHDSKLRLSSTHLICIVHLLRDQLSPVVLLWCLSTSASCIPSVQCWYSIAPY